MKPTFEVRDAEYYLDNAATTMMDEEVVEAMLPYLEERYGNASTPYHLGQEALDAVESARVEIARMLNCKPEEVFFTSGGTESNNWAIKGATMRMTAGSIVTSAVEHASVLEPVKWLAKFFPDDYTLSILDVDKEGRIDPERLSDELDAGDVELVSIQFGNNEVGTLQPVKDIGSLCKNSKVVFHCDACQAFGKVPIDVEALGIDMLTISAHKLHGPMGVGALYVRSGIDIEPLLHGGGHERGMRSGTLNVPAIVGFGKAAEIAWSTMKTEMPRVSGLVDEVANTLLLSMKCSRNGSSNNRLPHILSLSIPGVEASTLVGVLANQGVCVSTGSACNQKGRSHVLKAMGRTGEQCDSTIRISFGRFSKRNDALAIIGLLESSCVRARALEMM